MFVLGMDWYLIYSETDSEIELQYCGRSINSDGQIVLIELLKEY